MIVIFLDIDGVLATTKQFYMNKEKYQSNNFLAKELDLWYPFDKKCVDIFNEITDSCENKVVLSSDWKESFSPTEIDKIFKMNGVKAPIVDRTSDYSMFDATRAKIRQEEISAYIRNLEVKNYIILDDLPLTLPNFFHTNLNEGLKQTNLKNKILQKLNSFQN